MILTECGANGLSQLIWPMSESAERLFLSLWETMNMFHIWRELATVICADCAVFSVPLFGTCVRAWSIAVYHRLIGFVKPNKWQQQQKHEKRHHNRIFRFLSQFIKKKRKKKKARWKRFTEGNYEEFCPEAFHARHKLENVIKAWWFLMML